MKLIDAEIKAAKPKDKPYSMADGKGLSVLIEPSGAKYWRYRYRYVGKAKMLSLGVYPDVSLKDARKKHADARELLAQGIDPSEHRQDQKQLAAMAVKNSFEAVARRWWDNWQTGKSKTHTHYVMRRLEVDILPVIGKKPINEITTPMLIMAAKKIQSRGALDAARRVFNNFNQVFRYAVAHGLVERNPAADVKPSDVLKPTKRKNYNKIDAKDLPELLEKINTYGNPLTRLALQLMTLTFVRTNELTGARWDEIDGDLWRIPAERMKMKTQHIVPLSKQAIQVLGKIKEISSGNVFLFPGVGGKGKPIANNTMLHALYRMGYKGDMTGHGFRGLASTILHEKGYPDEHIELQLAHTRRNATAAAYNHSKHLEARKKMMQDWGDYLDTLKST